MRKIVKRGFRVLFACPKRTKRTKRGKLSSFKLFLSPRGDRCEQSAPTVRQLLNHGYRFETLKRRLGFAAVPCRAMANLAVDIMVLKLGSLCADGIWRQSVMHTSSVSLRLTPSAPVSATPTEFASQIGQFPLSRRRRHTCSAYVSIPLDDPLQNY